MSKTALGRSDNVEKDDVFFVVVFWLSNQSPDHDVSDCEINVDFAARDCCFVFAAEQPVSPNPTERAFYDPALKRVTLLAERRLAKPAIVCNQFRRPTLDGPLISYTRKHDPIARHFSCRFQIPPVSLIGRRDKRHRKDSSNSLGLMVTFVFQRG